MPVSKAQQKAVTKYMKENYDKFLQTSACHTLYVCKDVSKEEPEWTEFRGEISPIAL